MSSYISNGLNNGGRTQYFNFAYDSLLTEPRGLDLATAMMQTCDADFDIVQAWFSGHSLDMAFPINVILHTVSTDATGTQTDFVGGNWEGGFLIPLQATINIGELVIGAGSLIMLARYLLVSVVSNMFMRAFGTYGSNTPWFRLRNAGNKGEGLSLFMAEQFLLKEFPGVSALPSLTTATWNCTKNWLNSPRVNFLEINDEDISLDSPEVGCATLFLMYLHDQLGYSVVDIVNAGANHLSNVYENLTHDSWTNAWPKFSALVNGHYPVTPGINTYFPPLDTIFPLSDLIFFAAPVVATWLATAPVPLVVTVDHPAVMPIPLTITSSDTTIIPNSMLTIGAGMTSASVPLVVLPQLDTFPTTTVTLTVSYAGRTLTRNVTVKALGATTFGPLDIQPYPAADPCMIAVVASTELTLAVTNLNVFPDQNGLTFAWSVMGATPVATNTPTLTITALPAAGTNVTINLTVTNPQGLSAKGTYTFQTVSQRLSIKQLEAELACRLAKFRNGNLSIPRWVPIERGGSIQEQLKAVEAQTQAATKSISAITGLIKQMQKVNVEKVDVGPKL
ncbi:hypothetical protein [Terriglobus sp. TAA 43]|uniref:hypothetical protein n=1 Tax=Terriglobus sp. TAA 43 TaxID=278961 RepID=UPI000645EA66|nr:hypothetical protein [Terriglobus sp. TAA 43]